MRLVANPKLPQLGNLIIIIMKNKNGGIDGINSQVLKKIVDSVSNPLTHIFNLCIESEIWPLILR